MEFNIKKNKEDKVLKFVKQAIALYEPNSTSLRGDDVHKFHEYVYALSNLIEIPSIKDFNDKLSIIRRAVQKSKNYSKLTIKVFQNRLLRAGEKFLKIKKKYYVIFPLKIKYNSIKKRRFTLLDTKIKVRSYSYIKKNFSYDKLKEQAAHDRKIKESLRPNLTYFLIEVYSTDEYKGGNSAFETLELFRSIINFVDQYKKIHFQFGGEPKPLSLIYPPKAFFTFDSNRTYLSKWTTDITYDSNEVDFDSFILKNSKVIERSEKLIKKINSLKEGGIRDIILWAFYLHNNALDYYDKKWLSFLSFWQIFELITLSSKQSLKQDGVSKRILSLFKEKDPYEDILEVFTKKRNSLVHHGELRDFTENDINMIIGIAQDVIMFLIYNATNFNTINDLNFFYDNMHTSEKEFKIKKSILKFIEKIKS